MSSGIARAFDALAGRYDVLEPWYEHLYDALHAILRAELAPRHHTARPRALDAGCGSGFQTAVLEELGYESHGIDLSPGLLGLARERAPGAALAVGDLQALPYADATFDAITCCGSTLSFVGAPGVAVREIGRVLRPGGRLLLECEHKWSLDLAWALASGATRDSLGYGVPLRDLATKLRGRFDEGFDLAYPGYPPLRLFTTSEVAAMLRAAGLRQVRAWGLHSITNLIPSTVLHRERLAAPLRPLYRCLRWADAALAPSRPARWLANSLVVLAAKA